MHTPNTASQNPILDLLFANHPVRFFPRVPEPWPFRTDVLRALGLRKDSDILDSIPEKWVDTVLAMFGAEGVINHPSSVRNPAGAEVIICHPSSARKSGQRATQKVVIIAPIAAMMLAFRSRKPQALAFVEWLEDIMQQMNKYGVAVAGSDPAERCTLLWHRWKIERAQEIERANGELAARGLQTIALFAELNQIELRDALSFSRLASQEALDAGEARARVYTRTGMRRAYSEAVLRAALARLQPRLPLDFDLEAKA